MLCYGCQVEFWLAASGTSLADGVLGCVIAILLGQVFEIVAQILRIWLVYLG